MASRGLSDAQERKLRSIYEALDNNTNKKAVQLADKILKKQKEFVSVKGLKGLALFRMGRRDEAAVVIKEVRSVADAEEATVQALTLYYKESSQPDELCSFYENLVKKGPPSEELLAQLFMCYVRVGNVKKQQQTAMSLHKFFPSKNPYYFWAVMSIYLQACADSGRLAATFFLPLAERMVEKIVDEEKIEAEAEVRLYLMILLKLESYEKALGVVHTKLGNMFHSRDELVMFEIQILQHMARWKELISLYRTELNKGPENWSFWTGYMDALAELLASEGSAGCAVEHTLHGLQLFIEDLHESLNDVNQPPAKSRNLHLARLELIKRLLASDVLKAESKSLTIPTLLETLTTYVEVFGGKPTCFNDVRPYVDILCDEQRKSLVAGVAETARVATASSNKQESNSVKVSALMRECLAVQLARYTGQHTAASVAARRQLVKSLMQHHDAGLPLGDDLLPTDVQHVDNFPLLAAHILMDNDAELGGSEQDLFHAIVILEHALAASPSSPQLQLFLIKLYCRYGAFDPCAIMFNKLQIKHFLLETVGYLWSGPVFGLGYFRSGLVVAQMTLGMNTETAEFLITAYRSGTFHKVIEIMDFKESLQKSLQLATASALYQSIELLTKSHTIEDVVMRYQKTSPMVYPHAVAEQWRDLRDVRAMTSWAPPSAQISDAQKSSSFQLESLWVELRTCLNRSVCCMCSVAASFVTATAAAATNGSAANGSEGSTGDDLDVAYRPSLGSSELACKARSMDSGGLAEVATLVERIEKLCSAAAQHPGLRETYPLQGPHQTGLPAFLDGRHGNIHTAALMVAITTHNLLRPDQASRSAAAVSDEEQTDGVRKSLDGIASALQDGYAKARSGLTVSDGGSRRFVGTGLEALVCTLESLSTVVYLLSCANYFVSCTRGMSKKARKKKPTGVLGELLDLLTGAHVRITDLMADMRAYVDSTHKELVDGQILSVADAVSAQIADVYSSARKHAVKRVQDSHQQALDAIREALDAKILAFAGAKI